MENAVIYARFSDDRQNETSIEVQVEQSRQYADERGLAVIDTYIDRGITATDDKRPSFQRMVGDCKKKGFKYIIVYKSDRFSRNTEQYYIYKHMLKKSGVSLLAVHESYDDSPTGHLQEAVVVAFNTYFSEQSAVRISDGMRKKAEKGLYTGGAVPSGYKIEGQEFVLDPQIAPIIKLALTQYADGMQVREIIDRLNENGIMTAAGKKFTKSSFNTILNNKRYIGCFVYKDIEIPGRIPRIIDDETWGRVQRRRKQAAGTRGRRFRYLLTDKLFCGVCGERMYGYTGTSHSGNAYHYYKCSNRACARAWKYIPQQALEDFVVGHCRTLLTDDIISYIAIEAAKMSKEEAASPILSNLKRELRKAEAAIENLGKALDAGEEADFVLGRIGDKRREAKRIEKQIAEEEHRQAILTEPEIRFFLARLREGDIDDEKHRRTLVDVFVNKIFVFDDECTMFFNVGDEELEVTADDLEKPKRGRKRKADKCSYGAKCGVPIQKTAVRRFFVLVPAWVSDPKGRGRPVDARGPSTAKRSAGRQTRSGCKNPKRVPLQAQTNPQIVYYLGGFAVTVWFEDKE